MRSFLGACLLALSFASGARAQSADAALDDTERARLAFERGVSAYESGSFEEALTSFQRAYELTHDPQILYNVGTVADRLRRDSVALEAYEGYLAALPTAADRANVEARIAAIRAALPPEPTPGTIVEPTPEETVAPPIDTTPSPPVVARGPNEAGLVLAISGGVIALGGGALLVASLIEIDAASRVTTWAELMGPYERVPIVSAVGWLSLGIGVAIAGVGVGWIVAGDGSAGETVALRVGPGSVTVEGSF